MSPQKQGSRSSPQRCRCHLRSSAISPPVPERREKPQRDIAIFCCHIEAFSDGVCCRGRRDSKLRFEGAFAGFCNEYGVALPQRCTGQVHCGAAGSLPGLLPAVLPALAAARANPSQWHRKSSLLWAAPYLYRKGALLLLIIVCVCVMLFQEKRCKSLFFS